MSEHHVILGPGGIGGLIGTVLGHAGERVTLVVRPGSASRYPHRIHLEAPGGGIEAGVAVVERISGPVDVLWVTVKATQLEAALEGADAGLSVRAVVPLLNGLDHLAVLRRRFGNDRVVPATIAVEAELAAPGRAIQKSPFARLNVWEGGRDRLEPALAHLRSHGLECNYIADETTLMWSKLVFLAPVALVTTAAALPIGEVLADPARRTRFEAAQREACAVAVAEGAVVDVAKLILAGRALPAALRSSMQKDVERGRPPELDAIAGPILRAGERHGIATPAIRELAARVASVAAAGPAA